MRTLLIPTFKFLDGSVIVLECSDYVIEYLEIQNIDI